MARSASRNFDFLNDVSVKHALILFLVLRLFLSFWAIISLAINPLPNKPDEVLRPYLGETRLTDGAAGLLLGPWQRFDTQRYMHIARAGYADEENSVFPPLYPVAVRALGKAFGGETAGNLSAGIVISNLACIAMFLLLHRMITADHGQATATRALVYLALFPTGFFLLAPYTEPLFMLLALASLWSARQGRFWWSGVFGFFAAATRLTGWILVIPLAAEYWQQQRLSGWKAVHPFGRNKAAVWLKLFHPAALLPLVAFAGFAGWRWWRGLPSLTAMYEQYWYQKTGFPGWDFISAFNTLFFGGVARNNERIALSLDLLTALLLITTTVIAFRRLRFSYALYSALLLLFILLPTSEVKPLYSFSRYALTFFPTFILLALAGERPMVNRLILYSFLGMYLYFSGQYFVWGWVA